MPDNRTNTGGKTANRGQFKPGQSGNPGGRKRTDPAVKEMLKAACPSAVQLLINTMDDEDVKIELRVQCANTIIDRVMGKAVQPIAADVHAEVQPPTLTEMMARARELLEDG